jgi:hypothetical protein
VSTPQPVTRVGTTGGTYTALPAGLSIDASTGSIIPSTSSAGTYTVTYTIAALGGCSAVTATTTVTVNALPTLTITNPAPVCSPSTVDITAASVTSGSTGGLTYSYWTDAGATILFATPTTAGAGTYYIKGTLPATGCYIIKQVVVTVNTCFKTLNLTSVILQGLYNGGGLMNQAYDEYGAHWPAGVADHISVELHNSADYGIIVYTASDIPLSTNGTAIVSIPAGYNGSYYITIRHRNSLQTVSKTALSFAGSTINQSFGTPANVFGGNLRQMPVGYAIFGGDTNQDDIIDLGDLIPVGNQASKASAGYIPEDVNGDGLVDLTDLLIVGNSASLAIGAITP